MTDINPEKVQSKNNEKGTGIFYLYGLPPTIIESQVILTCLDLIEKGINIEIWSFCTTRKSYNEARMQITKWNGYNVQFSLFRCVRTGIPLSEFINALILGYWLIRNKKRPAFIHCRTEYPTVVALLIKPIFGTKVIWDARGDTESEFRLYIKKSEKIKRLMSLITILQIKIRLKLSKKLADRCIFVSDSLRRLYIKDDEKTFTIIPCVAQKKYFFFNQELRSATRNELGISPADIVFIYTGSMAIWQCVEETIKLIEDHLKTCINHKAIILTPDVERFLSLFSSNSRQRIICCSISLMNVNKYLNAADYAIFLRKKNTINKVASPVKFAEYCLAGLPIIMTNAVDQSYNFAIEINNLVSYKFGEKLNIVEKFSEKRRSTISLKSEELLSREKITQSLSEIYKSLR